ncbi:hypothetical protein HZB02_07765 [Candidatus Woesearchaeota archaeon]|nr:hypothetical protein [Candidatus Woesearchaeota archaeon]
MTPSTRASGIIAACQKIQKACRVLLILEKRSLAKSELVVKNATALLDVAPTGVFSWAFQGKQRASDKERIFEEVEKELQNLGTILELQNKYLLMDFGNDTEEETVQWILSLPLLHSVINSHDDKELLEEIVYKHPETIRRILACLMEHKEKVMAQEAAANLLFRQLKEIEERFRKSQNYFRFAELEETRKQEVTACVQSFQEHFKQLDRFEHEHPLDGASFRLGEMAREASRIVAENREIERLFNQRDLAELKELAGQQAKREQDKIAYFNRKLEEMRRLQLNFRPEQLIAVHVTNHFPENGVMRTTGQFTGKIFSNDKRSKEREVKFPRETIHFSLNGKVGSHVYGNWDSVKFAVLIPVHLIMQRIVNLNPVDTYVVGELNLPHGSEIIAREEDAVGHQFGNAKFVPVPNGKALEEVISLRIKERGFTPMGVGIGLVQKIKVCLKHMHELSRKKMTPYMINVLGV